GAIVGALSALGVIAGVALANALPERVLRLGFAALMVFVAVQLLRRWARVRGSRKSPDPAKQIR
ncbi:MAG: hypothetical protein ACXVQR_02010, partial [Solirubrobacteraceae bacterium]